MRLPRALVLLALALLPLLVACKPDTRPQDCVNAGGQWTVVGTHLVPIMSFNGKTTTTTWIPETTYGCVMPK